MHSRFLNVGDAESVTQFNSRFLNVGDAWERLSYVLNSKVMFTLDACKLLKTRGMVYTYMPIMKDCNIK